MTFKSQLAAWKSYIVSLIPPAVEVLLTNPLSIIKINRQQNMPIPWSLKGLYKGAGINAIGFIPTTSMQISVAQCLEQDVFSGNPTQLQKIIAASVSGVASSVFSGPIELLMTQLNSNNKSTLINAVNAQYNVHGLSGFFVGQVATACREAGFSIFFIAITPLLKKQIKPYCPHDASATVVAGACSGFIGTVLTQPVDVIKTTQQADSFNKKNVGFFKTAQHIGYANLWRGLLPRSSSIIVSITVMTWVKEQLETLCHSDINRACKAG